MPQDDLRAQLAEAEKSLEEAREREASNLAYLERVKQLYAARFPCFDTRSLLMCIPSSRV